MEWNAHHIGESWKHVESARSIRCAAHHGLCAAACGRPAVWHIEPSVSDFEDFVWTQIEKISVVPPGDRMARMAVLCDDCLALVILVSGSD